MDKKNIWSLCDKRLSILKSPHRKSQQPKKYKPKILQEIPNDRKTPKCLTSLITKYEIKWDTYLLFSLGRVKIKTLIIFRFSKAAGKWGTLHTRGSKAESWLAGGDVASSDTVLAYTDQRLNFQGPSHRNIQLSNNVHCNIYKVKIANSVNAHL